jgi:hypothetical protein
MKNLMGLLAVSEIRKKVIPVHMALNKGRYDHWFWNNWLISWLEGASLRFSSYLWQKQYNRED